jgi:pimeloyl-ACP methyl ester carboxylesterase
VKRAIFLLLCASAALAGGVLVLPPVIAGLGALWPTVRDGHWFVTLGLGLVVTGLFNWCHSKATKGPCVRLLLTNVVVVVALLILFWVAGSTLQRWSLGVGAGSVFVLAVWSALPRKETHSVGDMASPLHVVFVHGILGDDKTWGRFPELLASDRELPALSIDVWRYQTVGCRCDNPVATISRTFGTRLRMLASGEDVQLYLVGHSMGGLVILKALIDEMTEERAALAPVANVAMISLYATPCGGAAAANVVRALWTRRLFLHRLSPQVDDLRKGDFTSDLMGEVVNRIYRPSATPAPTTQRRIPVRVTIGTRDPWVRLSDAKVFFRDPAPHFLEQDHYSIKEPVDWSDLRYKGFRDDLEDQFRERFRTLCQDCMAADEAVHRRARDMFSTLYNDKLIQLLKRARGPEGDRYLTQLIAATWIAGADGPPELRPSRVIGRALETLLPLTEPA